MRDYRFLRVDRKVHHTGHLFLVYRFRAAARHMYGVASIRRILQRRLGVVSRPLFARQADTNKV